MSDRNRDLLEENLRSIERQSAAMAAEAPNVSQEAVEAAVEAVEAGISETLGVRSRPGVGSGDREVADGRIRRLVELRSRLYDGTTLPEDVDEALAEALSEAYSWEGDGDGVEPEAVERAVEEASEPAEPTPVPDEGEGDGDEAEPAEAEVETEVEAEADDADGDAVAEAVAADEGTEPEGDGLPEDAVPIDLATLRATKPAKGGKAAPRHAKVRRPGPLARFWAMLRRTAHEVSLITWPSAGTTAIMSVKTVILVAVIATAVMLADYGSSQLVGWLAGLRP